MWMLRKSNLLEVAKYVTAVVTIPATYNVFYNVFSAAKRGMYLSSFTAICSIILIDVLLLYFLYILEEGDDPVSKWPDAFGAVALAAANIAIGFYDEGALAWVPRVGLIALVSRDIFMWILEYSRFYNSYEAVESRLRDRQKIIRRRMDFDVWKTAHESLRLELEAKQLENEIKLRQLDRASYEQASSQDSPDLVEVGDSIYKRQGLREYLWSTIDGELVEKTATGQPYLTLRGAKQARTKHLKSLA